MAIDYPRAMAAYKIGAEAGDARCQHQLGFLYSTERLDGVAVDYKQARAWLEKAAAQDWPTAVGQLGTMCFDGKGMTKGSLRG